jgi:hypothetical protein
MTLICVIRSTITAKQDANILEPGFFELSVHVRMSEATASGDPQGFVKQEIARHLAGCVVETGFPLHEKLWHIGFTKFAQSNFNFPEGFTI